MVCFGWKDSVGYEGAEAERSGEEGRTEGGRNEQEDGGPHQLLGVEEALSGDIEGEPISFSGTHALPFQCRYAIHVLRIHQRLSLLLERKEKRLRHFMKAGMLDSQLGTLESLEGEDGVVVVSVEDSMEEQVRQASEALRSVVGVPKL